MGIILLDTDVAKRLQTNNISQTGDILAVSLLTFFELPPHKLDIYDKFNLRTMLDFIEIIIYEEMTKQCLSINLGEYFKKFPLINNETEEKFMLLRLKPDSYPKEKNKMDLYIADHQKATLSIWQQIPAENKMANVLAEDIDEEEDSIFQHVVNDYQNEQDTFNRFVFEKFSKLIEKFSIEEFKNDCPACRALIRIQAFINVLIKKGQKNSDGKIQLNFKDKKSTISVKSNFFADLKISAAYLPYILNFKTHDKVQSSILKELFPRHKDKIELLPQK